MREIQNVGNILEKIENHSQGDNLFVIQEVGVERSYESSVVDTEEFYSEPEVMIL